MTSGSQKKEMIHDNAKDGPMCKDQHKKRKENDKEKLKADIGLQQRQRRADDRR